MPRNGSGFYTLPAGNPVAPATIIESDWANDTMSDIAVQLNNVLTRDGLLGPTVAFKVIPGAATTPGLVANAYPSSGFYWDVGKIGASINGVSIGTIESDGLHMNTFGAHVGNVTGNLTGNVTGNVTGTVTGHSSLDVLKAGDSMTGALNISQSAAAALILTRTTSGGNIAGYISAHASQGVYSRWAYNSGGNTNGFIGSAEQVFGGSSLVDQFAIRAETALQLGISTNVKAAIGANGFAIGGPITGPGFTTTQLWVHAAANKNLASFYNGNFITIAGFDDAGGAIPLSLSSSNNITVGTAGNLTLGTSAAFGMLGCASQSLGTVTGVGAWDNKTATFGPNIGSSTGAALALGYDNASDGAAIWSLAPGVAWKKLTIGSAGLDLLAAAGALALRITSAGVIQDGNGFELGYKGLPLSGTTSGSLLGTDRGKLVRASSGITWATTSISGAALGDVWTIYNNSAGNITITQGASTTLSFGPAGSGNRTLGVNGVATILYVGGSTQGVISGSGLS
jgi:hypothetical protein